MSPERKRQLGHRPALDGVRAVAILAVVGFHAVVRPTGGFLGVHVFFVLSGFLITTILLEEWSDRGAISLRQFYRRRALRLLPALGVALVGFAAAAVYLVATGRADQSLTSRSGVVGALVGVLYVSNVVQAAGVVVPGSIGHLWSLATEEQFYLLWPVCLVAMLRAGRSLRWIGTALVAAIAIVAGHRLEMTLRGVPQPRIYFGPDGSFDLILVGCLAGVVLTGCGDAALARVRTLVRIAWLPSAALVALALLAAEIADRSLYEGVLLGFGALVALLLLHVVLVGDSLLARALALRPLVYLGRISYGVYLWHQIVLAGGLIPFSIGFYPRAALGIAATLAIASLSYHVVEQPFLRRKRREPVSSGAPVQAAVAAATP